MKYRYNRRKIDFRPWLGAVIGFAVGLLLGLAVYGYERATWKCGPWPDGSTVCYKLR